MEEKMISMSETVFNKLTSIGVHIGQLTMAVKHYQELKPMASILYLVKCGEKLTPSIIEEHEEGFKKVFATIKEDQKYIEANSSIKMDIPDTFEEFERHVMTIPITGDK